ncbi:putative Ig domain-containing protein [Lysobacter sp. cf310]|uniref:putative Ig domain-containing protein n=1 Tax=Lysobacter sp. cf310 TaxID=1761790 RepID=UPI0008F364AF|nr:putative Ig domain-containing protein [Lysobacter sp. cf310]SFK25795.1 RHS repeat-associated core domain-containing protein [Lysobacter sp. cf310]
MNRENGRSGRSLRTFAWGFLGAVVVAGAVLASGAQQRLIEAFGASTPDANFCAIYPIAVPASLLQDATPGTVFERMPRGTGAGNYSWLTWSGHPSAPTLAASLVPPGDSDTYRNPDDAQDQRLDIGDWAQGAPGSMNAAQVRKNMAALVGRDIVVPAYSQTRGQGNRYDYRVQQFAVIRLRDYQLTGHGWLSFEFRGYQRCYNQPPVAQDQNLSTPEDTALTLRLTASDTQSDSLTYEVLEQPQHGTLTGSAPDLVYTPSPNYNGPDRLTFRSNDGEFDSNVATVAIEVTPVNDPPHITSVPPLRALDNTPYRYPVTAEDIDVGDVLTYSLVNAPDGMRIDPATGLIEWSPGVDQAGEHPVTVAVTDRAGASDAQSFVVVVERSNRPPLIVTSPVHDAPELEGYLYPLRAQDPDLGDLLRYQLLKRPDGMTIASDTGDIAWNGAGWAGNNRLPNAMCMAGGERTSSLAAAADVVVVVDESGSMSGEHDWIADFAAPLEAHLTTNGVGDGAVPNRYGLLAYDPVPLPINVGTTLTGDYRQFITASAQLALRGSGTEDGWRAVRHAIFQYPLRETTARNIILVTDEDRDNTDASITYASLLGEMRAQKAVLNAVVNARFKCGDGSAALGLGQHKVGYKADGRGGFQTCANASAYGGDGTTIADYVNMALETGGAAWDIEVLRDGGRVAQSFTNALLKIKVQEILQQLPTRNLPDVYVHGLSSNGATIELDIGNRGLAPVGDAVAVQIFADDQLVSVEAVPDLAAGALSHLTVPWWVQAGTEPSRLSARILVPTQVAECASDNNALDVAWVRARVTDRAGLYAEQSFSVQVLDQNQAPAITSTPVTTTGVGRRYVYAPTVADPDRGDAMSYTLAVAPIGMAINRLTGELTFVPDASQAGTHTVELVVRDLAGAEVRQRYTLGVDAAILPPRFVSEPERRAVQGTLYAYATQVTAAPSSELRYDVFMGPAGLSIDAATGAVQWQVPAAFAGKSERVVLRVRDQHGNYDLQVYTLLGDLPNQAPRITNAPALQATLGSAYSYSPTVSDVNVLEQFAWQGTTLPPGADVDGLSGRLSWPAASVNSRYPAAMAAANPFCLARDPAVGEFAPGSRWANAKVRFPTQPLVGPILDTDMDGQLTSADLTAVVAISWTDTTVGNRRLHAFDADTGETLWSYNQRTPDWYIQPAMADLEGQGNVSILFVDSQRYLVALRPDGSQRWVSNVPVAANALNYNAISVSDLDGDGSAEILIGPSVFGAGGTLKWQFPASADSRGQALAIDLDQDGRREVLYRGEIRDANGALRKKLPSALDGTVNFAYYAPVRVAGSARAHIAISESTSRGYRLSLVDADGNNVWLRTSQVSVAGPLLVADFTGDGSEDVFVAASGRLHSSAGGETLWDISGATNWSANNSRAAMAADIDRDGELEIFTTNPGYVQVVAGRTGAVLWRFTGMSDHHSHTPTLVDLDGDGNATLLVSESNALRAYASTSLPWHAGSRVLHQSAFALDQVRSDLRPTPADVSRPPAALYVQGQRQAVSQATAFRSDLRVSAPYGVQNGAGITLTADVGNRGTAASRPLEVAFYRGGVDSGSLIGKATVPAVAPGQSVAAQLATTIEAVGNEEVTAVILAAADENECELGNNMASGRMASISVADHGGLQARLLWVIAVSERMLAPSITSTAPRNAIEHQAYRYQAAATSPHLGDAVTYELSSAPEGAIVNPRTGEVTWIPRWGQVGRYTFVLAARSLNGIATQQSWTVDVSVSTEPNRAPTIVSTAVTAATVDQVYRYDVRATDPEGQRIRYSLEGAPAGMQIDARTGTVLWQPSTAPATPVAVKVVATDERNARAEQAYAIKVYATPNRAPSITSTPGLSMTLGQAYEYAAAAVDPDGDPLSYVWNRLPAGAAIGPDSTVRWTPSAAQAGAAEFELEVRDDRGGWARQTFTVYVNDPVNHAPQIVSTPNPRAIVGQAYVYDVAAEDVDGDSLSYSLLEYPRGMVMAADTGRIEWTPALNQIGQHALKVQVADGRGGVAWQTFTLEVVEQSSGGGNGAPVIHSAPATSAKLGRAYRYDVLTLDPDGDLLAYSLTQAPAGMTIDAQTGRIDWQPSQTGDFPVRLRVSDGALWTEQAWLLHVVEGLPFSATLDVQPPQVGPNEVVTVQVLPVNAGSQVSVELRMDGAFVPVDANLRALVQTTLIGRHALVAIVSDGTDTVEVSGEFTVLDANSSEGPTLTLTAPADDAVVTAPTTVTGSVQDADLAGWKLFLVDRDGSHAQQLASGTTAVSGALGQLDPTRLLNGQYVVVLEAWDSAGHQSKAFSSIVIDGEMKLGHFSLSFPDVSIPVMGIPITVTRTYDTRRSHEKLDFGYGWSVDYQNVRVHESRTIGLGWSLNEYRSGFFSNWCVQPQGDPIVTVALPDGKLEKFRAKAMPECQYIVPNVDVQIVFEALPGTTSKLEQTTLGNVRLAGNQLIDLGEIGPADPNDYALTTKEGMRYDLRQGVGIRRVTDLDGNTLTYTRDGIVHSSGVGVQFIRDSAGRISTIRLPDGNFIDYTYDFAGNLSASVDQRGGVTRYGYLEGRFPHYLQDIIDPRGIRASRSEYDENGRLIAHIDAEGRRIEYTVDLVGRTQVVKNRLGQSTTYAYDENGRVTQEVNALGEVTKHGYDVYGNELSRENGEGEVWRWEYDAAGNKISETNPLNQTTRWTYDSRGQVLTQTDASGATMANNVYNSRNGQLTSATNALGLKTEYGYATSGDLASVRLPDGTTTSYAYDSRGNKTRETNALGSVIVYTYDDAGHVLTETRTRTAADGSTRSLVTRHTYDAKGNRTSTTDAAGQVSRWEYNAIDKPSAEIDANGNRTEMDYDAFGQLVETRHPDGTRDRSVYDAESRVIATIDRAGRTTTMVYDAAGRLIETHLPDGAVNRVGYDKAGREVRREDARGNVTTIAYDDAGRQTVVTDALGRSTTTAYNVNGTKASVKDALARTTKFVYDPMGRLVETIHPDTTTADTDNPRSRVGYDAQGRKASTTDEMGRVTAFEYTPTGQLSAVVDAAGSRTTFGYDELGNKIAQTDALGRVTQWAYDDAGRPVARTLPGGQVETWTYDGNGNRIGHVDFNGAQRQFRYDSMNRELEVRHADGSGAVTTYTATGQIATRADAAGTATYGYDAGDRLNSVVQADGVTIAYQYDLMGNRLRMTTANQDIAYSYDELNRLATVVRGGATTTYGYNEVGSRSLLQLPNGNRADYTYDVRNRLKTLTHRSAANAVLLGFTYTVDNTGLRTQAVESSVGSTRTVTYQYDALKRLKREQVVDSTRGNRTTDWTYDAVGNRLTQVRTKAGVTASTAYTYDANDRLEREDVGGGGSVQYRYDANGSLIERSDVAGLSVYSYDGGDRLVDAVTPTGAMSYRYDPAGIRQGQTVNGVTTRYVVDPTARNDQVIEEHTGSRAVLYLIGDDRIGRSDGAQTVYLHGDGLGSTRLLTTSAGAAADRYWFEAFGETESHTGSSDNAFLFAGEQLDPNLGFYYLRARYMNPANGRFTQMDAYAGDGSDPVSLHKYLYANANPAYYVDPSGYFSDLGGMTMGLQIQAQLSVTAVPSLVTAGLIAKVTLYSVAAVTGTYVLTDVLIRTKLEECINSAKSGQNKCKPQFAMFLVGDDSSEVREHVGDALSEGKPSMLSRQEPPHSRAWLRLNKGPGRACAGGAGTDCDEYPWAASREGGAANDVSLRSVNESQNRSVGSHLRWFHARCGIPANTPSRKYKVVAVRGLPVTGYVCSR